MNASPNGRLEIRLAGSGGQGVVRAGVTLAEAAILSGRNAAHLQAYGPESRGGATRSDVVIADGEIVFPCAQRLDILVALTRESYERHCQDLRPTGVLLADTAAEPDSAPNVSKQLTLPFAESAAVTAANPLAATIVALGALAEVTGAVSIEALERAVAARVPPGSRRSSLTALAAGRALAQKRGA